MIEDIYSRKIVGWEVHSNETGEQAAELLERSIWLQMAIIACLSCSVSLFMGAGLSAVSRLSAFISPPACQRCSVLIDSPINSMNKLTEQERHAIIAICNADEFASLPPSQIVPILADRGEYIASESSFYRVLKDEGMLHHRGDQLPSSSPQ
jgi:hypothetical protein